MLEIILTLDIIIPTNSHIFLVNFPFSQVSNVMIIKCILQLVAMCVSIHIIML